MSRFGDALSMAADYIATEEREGIGRLNEGMLHRTLKFFYEPDVDRHERKIGRFVADIVNDEGIIEIQTRAFSNLREKLQNFLTVGRVTVVFPVATEKYIQWCDPETGELTAPRKSPRKGKVFDVFPELYRIKNLLTDPHLTVKVVLLSITDRKLLCGWDETGKKGSRRMERVPNAFFEEITLGCPADYAALLPEGLDAEGFTVKDLAKLSKITKETASAALRIMAHVGAVRVAGKAGRSYLYSVIAG